MHAQQHFKPAEIAPFNGLNDFGGNSEDLKMKGRKIMRI
jgi:hypothetical protein